MSPAKRLCLSATAELLGQCHGWQAVFCGEPAGRSGNAASPRTRHHSASVNARYCRTKPSAKQLDDDPQLHRFTVSRCSIVKATARAFSPRWNATAHPLPASAITNILGSDWPEQPSFFPTEIRLASGERSTIRLAEREHPAEQPAVVREFRKLTESGHQTAFLSTDYRRSGAVLPAPAMFWSMVAGKLLPLHAAKLQSGRACRTMAA